MEKKRLLEFRKPRTGKIITFRTRQYYVTDDGQVWNEELKRYVAQWESQNGYLAVNLTDDNGTHHSAIYVHNLVASVFKRLLEKGVNVHHKNHVKTDNNLSNLEVMDGKEHQRQHNYEKWASGTYDCQKKQVVQLSLDGQLIKAWSSTNEAGRNGFDQSAVAHCCKGEGWGADKRTFKGFKWMWLSDYEAQKEEEANLYKLASS